MILYSGELDIFSHACRFVLFEKDVECEVRHVHSDEDMQALAELNPYNETPTLVDRDLVLYGAHVINEYLDERLPHPPLMPVDPVSRGRARLMISRLERDWMALVAETGSPQGLDSASRQVLRDGLLAMSPVFGDQPYMLGDEFSLVDCYLAALLWRLPWLGIKLPRQAKPLLSYGERLFLRPAFAISLSDAEREIRTT